MPWTREGIAARAARSPQLDPASIDDIVLGNANGAGEDNRNVARMAGLLAGLPVTVPGATVNRLCGSGLEAVIQAGRALALGDAHVVVAGGVESMSRAPWVLPKPAGAFPVAHERLWSTTLGWRMTNPAMPAEWTVALGESAELIARKHGISRWAQDAFALDSHEKAARAWAEGRYEAEIVPVEGTELPRDECIRDGGTAEAMARLEPAFVPHGTVTAGNSSPLRRCGLPAAGRRGRRAGHRARTTGRDPCQRGQRHRARPLRVGAGGGVKARAGPLRTRLRRPRGRRTQRGVRRPGPGLPGRTARARPAEGQSARRCHRRRQPLGCLRRTPRRRGGAPARGSGTGLATLCIGVGQGLALVLER